MAVILNLETATTNCSVSVGENGNILALKEDNTPNYSHSEQLHVFIKNALDTASLSFSDLDAISVSKGPGSYTGLRIGVSAAKGLCFALDIPLISIATLESMAHQARMESFDFIIPVLDARRMEVYSAVFDANFNQIRETKAEIITESSFAEYVKTGKTLLLGPGAKKCDEVLSHANFVFMDSIIPSAKDMNKLSFAKYQKSVFEDVAYFEPYYLKDFIIQGKAT
ncbi:tRNA (adenosine(37)-N6)-threonylcarbamoyltransferase complex dimerization subunit type 1 TsaB [Ulvibacterium marinum]|uniref:tRNA (Adenosine(37)-N6)-threonylcarbamoyltransferase complex dimerization subunit type 1 TsaB n=1 Tax=Ulvibacterium marinum TaxID=2419782 RepID=A0A3B0C2C0_9FLAO|nr:tRNA (adenosine(37)-N6)-threonylcarbamoyltransferase complex dimerization subunit type 1 TsaB [Ulvibacterium marinum]RKN79542.1 tRNA (adenosine(37)-N6)-threonylcarbamoyltransferase complex dimerization subunit type 1 TsaB [Ulvibacterium marinum]